MSAKPQPGMALYEEPNRLFTCAVPAAWRVLEGQGGAQRVSFYGPSNGPKPYSAEISVYHYPPGSAYASPEDYALAQRASGARASPLAERTWKGGKAYAFTTERMSPAGHGVLTPERRREETVLIASKSGLLALVHSAPAGREAETATVFSAFLESLRPL